MNKKIEDLFGAIAREIYTIRPETDWIRGTYEVLCITSMMSRSCLFLMKDGSRKSGSTSHESGQLFFDLRNEMAKLHENGHAWYTATCTLTTDGKFKFDFDYDHLPAFSIIPNPEKWILEFKEYPRPDLQLHVQDWMEGKAEPEVIVDRLRKLQGAAKS